jgi:mRNA interferase MazF
MDIRRGYLYVVAFNPQIRTKPGKLRPAVVLQSDLVNEAGYPSTVVIPTTSKLIENPGLLRLHLPRGQTALSPSPMILSGGRSAHSRTT